MASRFKYLFLILGLALTLLIVGIASYPDGKLYIIACDVGQGDAILIKTKNTQLLIDGGKDDKVLNCLAKYMPFWDKEIEVVILTHQQIDHYGGFIEVFKAYNVQNFLISPIDSSSQSFSLLKSLVGGSGTHIINPTTGMVLRFGLIHLDIVHPSSEFLAFHTVNQNTTISSPVLGASTTFRNLNDFSVVLRLKYKDFDALFTGDMGSSVVPDIISKGTISDLEYIKVPHHGSKNGLTQELLDISNPKVAVISVGKNQWGHPHKEVIKLLSDKGIKILRTDQKGDIQVVTDGKSWWIK